MPIAKSVRNHNDMSPEERERRRKRKENHFGIQDSFGTMVNNILDNSVPSESDHLSENQDNCLLCDFTEEELDNYLYSDLNIFNALRKIEGISKTSSNLSLLKSELDDINTIVEMFYSLSLGKLTPLQILGELDRLFFAKIRNGKYSEKKVEILDKYIKLFIELSKGNIKIFKSCSDIDGIIDSLRPIIKGDTLDEEEIMRLSKYNLHLEEKLEEMTYIERLVKELEESNSYTEHVEICNKLLNCDLVCDDEEFESSIRRRRDGAIEILKKLEEIKRNP